MNLITAWGKSSTLCFTSKIHIPLKFLQTTCWNFHERKLKKWYKYHSSPWNSNMTVVVGYESTFVGHLFI